MKLSRNEEGNTEKNRTGTFCKKNRKETLKERGRKY